MSTTTNKKRGGARKIIGLKDLRLNMEKYIKAVDKGESFTVVRRSKPIFAVTPLDEWGDPVGEWNDGLDFRDLPGGGMPAEDFLKLLKKYGPKRKVHTKTKR